MRSASGTSGCGRSTGYHARKNESLSVTRSSAPPEMRTIASPRQTCESENVRPSTTIPSHRPTSFSASSASRAGSGRPVNHHAPSRCSAGRSAAYANTSSGLTSCPRPSASKTARPGNSPGRYPSIAQCATSLDGARPGPTPYSTPEDPDSHSRSRFGVAAASTPLRPPSDSCARSASPSSRKTTIGFTQTVTLSSERITRATAGGTSDCQSSPARIAARTSAPEICFSAPSSRTTTS